MKSEPAFPSKITHPGIDETTDYRGMSLRDYFAAQAMQGLLSNQEYREQQIAKASSALPRIIHMVVRETISEEAYEIADAMLKAREQE